jgi:membrane fusion protein, multidrug efflux system
VKRWVYLIAAAIVIVVVIGGIKAYSVSKMIAGFKAKGEQKFAVTATKAELSDWQPTLSAVATLHAVHGADISPEVAGIVDVIAFESGQDVHAGQQLVRLRAADDLAHLASLKATAALNQTVYTRDKAQLEAQALSQATLDGDAANLKAAQALVDEQQAVADKKFIRAPFAGRVGIRAVDPGQYVGPGTKLVTLQSLDPIFADFYLPQQALSQIAVGQVVALTLPGAAQPVTGKIDAINPQVDVATRNVQIRASLSNPEHKLLPGMFVNAEVSVGQQAKFLTLPQTAITYNPYGASVFVITMATATQAGDQSKPAGDAQNKSGEQAIPRVHQQFVQTGAMRGDQVAIVKGLQPGDEVVTGGQLKLKNGAAVAVDTGNAPPNDPHPSLPNE